MADRIGKRWQMLNVNITGALAAQVSNTFSLAACAYICIEAIFTYVASAATSVDAWLQTSLDGGATWIDIANFHFTTSTASKVSAVVATTALAAAVTPGDAALSANTILSGLLGDQYRVKWTSVGTYGAGTSLKVNAVAKAAA